MPADGTVLKPLDEDDARALAARLREAGAESVAVCLLHAHLYPEHERRLGEILREELPGIPVSLSSEILREQQEYERTATTVVNAYVRPLMARYVADLQRGLGDAATPLTIMQSSGGVMTRRRTRPSGRSTRSSPARRPASSRRSRSRGSLGLENAIAFDMGGTTAKASLIEDGRVSRSHEYEVGASLSAGSRLLRGSGELIRIPTIDIAEVGAGGGSIALARRGRRRSTSARAARAPRPGPPATASAAPSRRSPTRTSCSATSPRGARIGDGQYRISRERAAGGARRGVGVDAHAASTTSPTRR